MSDPLSAAIDAAVTRAFEAQFPKFLAALEAAQKIPAPPPATDTDRFVWMAEVARLLGVHRATLHKMQRAGKLPPHRKFGNAAGYLLSEVKAIQDGLAVRGPVDEKRAEQARGRMSRRRTANMKEAA